MGSQLFIGPSEMRAHLLNPYRLRMGRVNPPAAPLGPLSKKKTAPLGPSARCRDRRVRAASLAGGDCARLECLRLTTGITAPVPQVNACLCDPAACAQPASLAHGRKNRRLPRRRLLLVQSCSPVSKGTLDPAVVEEPSPVPSPDPNFKPCYTSSIGSGHHIPPPQRTSTSMSMQQRPEDPMEME